MLWLAIICGILGGFVALLNFYTSSLRYPIQKRLHPDMPYRHVSGFPLIGNILLIVAAICAGPSIWLWLLIPLMILDTGGLHWLAYAILRGQFKK